MDPVVHTVFPLLPSPPPLILSLRGEGKNDEGGFFKLRIFFYAHQTRKGTAVAALIRQGVRRHEFRGFNRKDAASALRGTLNSAM